MRSLLLRLSAILGCATSAIGVHAQPFEAYAFVYFTGDTLAGENIYFAASEGNDALNWTEVNGGKPVLTSTMGTKGLRDPFILRSNDGNKFFLMATDLSIGSGTSWTAAVETGSRYIEVWESTDLKNWSDQRHVLVSPPTVGMTWAPAAYYDTVISSYVVFWASSLYNKSDINHTKTSYERMLLATTDDFVTFSDPVIWQDAGSPRIDTRVTKVNDIYYRFTKDDGAVTGCADIIQDSSANLTASLPAWKITDTCIAKKIGLGPVEGPTVFTANPGDVNGQKYYLFVDEYESRGYVPLETEDIAKPNWTVSASYNLPSSPRHGAVIPITKKELASLKEATRMTKRSPLTKITGSPVLPGLWADPNMVIFGNEYYIYPTIDGFANWGGQEFWVWKSPDLVNWTRGSEPFLVLNGTHGNVPWASGNAWSPTIAERQGKYYFYFSGQNIALNEKTIGAAVADSPEGPFVAQTKAMILNNESVSDSQAIDPAFFLDPPSGKYYLIWGNGDGAVRAELGDDMVSIKKNTLGKITGLTNYREAPFLVYRKGLYHLTWSINDTRSADYSVGYATSTTLNGTYTNHGVILQKNVSQGILATGGSSIVNVPGTDNYYICYHRFAIPNGDGTHRETTIDRLTFDPKTGLIQHVVPTLTSVPPELIM